MQAFLFFTFDEISKGLDMYKYLKLDSEYFEGLVESLGKEAIAEIILNEIPLNYEKYTSEAKEAIANDNFAQLKLCVHTIKSDFRHFIPEDDPIIKFIQDFENRAKAKADGEQPSRDDFSADLQKLKELTAEPLEEILMLKNEYENA